VRLDQLTPAILQAAYARLLGRGLSPKSVLNAHRLLHRALADAVRWGLLARNPCDLVDPPRVPRPVVRALDADGVARLLAACAGDDLGPLITVAVLTGLRLGELLGLQWDDVDLEAGAVYVRPIFYRMRGQWVESEPRSAAGKRKVVLPAPVLVMLREYRKAQLEQRLKAGPDWHQEFGDLVFSTASGRPIHPANIHRELKAVLSRAGLPPIRFHDLRHTHASLLLKDGVNPRVVQERLGHSTVSLTLQVYSHVLPDLSLIHI